MFINRRNFYYQNQPYPTSYTQAQIQQYRENVLATRAKLQAYKEAVIEAEMQNRANDAVAFVRGAMIESPGGTPPSGQDFIPYGHVSQVGSTPQSYSLWGSSGDSNTDSITSHKRKFGKTLCRILTGFAAVLILMAVVGIVGIAIYLGYFSSQEDMEGPNYTEHYVGDLRITRGDSWVQDLTFPDSPAFRAKAAKYKNMLASVFENSALGPSIQSVKIQKFQHSDSEQGFQITFQINLDRTKIPFWHLRDTDQAIEKILEQELKSYSPIAFQTLQVDTDNLNIRKVSIEASPYEKSDVSSRERIEVLSREDLTERMDDFDVVPLKGIGGILRLKNSDTIQNTTEKFPEVVIKKKPTTTDSTVEKITLVTERPTSLIESTTTAAFKRKESTTTAFKRKESTTTAFKRKESTTTDAIEKKETISPQTESTIRKLVTKVESTTEDILQSVPLVITDNGSTQSTTETSTTLRTLIYELSPWKPISPDFIKPEFKETETKEMPDAIDEKDMIKFLPHEGATALHFEVSKGFTPISTVTVKVPTGPPPAFPPSPFPLPSQSLSSSSVSSSMIVSSIDETKPSSSDKDLLHQHTFTDEISSHVSSRNDIPSVSSGSSDDETNEVLDANPTVQDIQSILENLLYIATMKPDVLLNSNINSNPESKEGTKSQTDTFKKDQTETTVVSESKPPNVRNDFYTDVRDFKKPIRLQNGQYPLDRFRYQAQNTVSTTSTTTERIVPFLPNLSLPFNIWNMLTTKKPMLLDTEVVTSTSVNVQHGSSTEGLMPIYIHSSTIRNILDAATNLSEPHFIIPVISGKEVQYIKVNRTKPNYPNVVIVNLADSQTGETNLGSMLLNDKGREIEFSAEFVESISNLLNQIKQQNENQEGNESVYETFRNNQGDSAKIEEELSKHISVEPSASNITFWNALSYLSKLYLREQNIMNRKTSSSVISGQPLVDLPLRENPHLDLPENLPYAFSNQENIVRDSSVPYKKAYKKSGKSLKLSPTLTLFVVRDKNRKEPRLISVFGRSPEIKYSSSHSPANSPIHVFKFKEGQSLDELLGEIFEVISKDKEDTFSFSSDGKGRDEKDGALSKEESSNSQAVPAGEDSLKVIEALSKLLTDHYDNYNLIFGSDSTKRPSTSTTTPKIDTPPFKSSVWTELNEISPTTQKYELPTVSKYPKNDTKLSYHKYHHELFPVMTRPLNPIRTTTPKVFTTLPGEAWENLTLHPDPIDVVTSFDVSYSVFSANNFSNAHKSGNKSGECTAEEFKCLNKMCVPLSSRCNMVRDCEDNSDERNCNCSEMLAGQHYTRKICDGIIDCWDSSDETHCDWCAPGHFICSGYQKCIKPELVCDGEPDCPNGDDERDCVTIAPNIIGANSIDYFDEGYLMVRRKGTWGKLCVENFEKTVAKADLSWSVGDLGDAVCKTLTFDSSSRVERTYDTSPPIFRSANVPYFEINISDDYTDIGRQRAVRSVAFDPLATSYLSPSLKGSFYSYREALIKNKRNTKSKVWKREASSDFELSLQFQETKCIKRDVVKVRCQELQCGVRPRATIQKARIVGGNNSSPGAWPWHAALYKEGEYQCGATLISDRWLLSAGHCFYSARSAYWVARMGALRRGTKFPSPFEQVRPISHIFIHPEYVNQGFINDISMLRLEQPVKLNDYVRPVCLPSPDAEITDGQRCTLVGWGQLFEVKKVFPDTLQEVEVPLISTNECRKRTLFLPLYRITEDMFCAGYVRGGRDACLGDSGGPLMCQRLSGSWEVMGVTSNGYGCARPHRPGVYTKVGNYLPWIHQVLKLGDDERVIPEEVICQGRRCPLGECIPPSGICDGKVECSDGIDERDCS